MATRVPREADDHASRPRRKAVSVSLKPLVSSTAWARDPGAQRVHAVTDIYPSRGWQLINARELWLFRDVVYSLMLRDLKVRYKQTILGAAWAIIQPATMTVVFALFLGRVARAPSGTVPPLLFLYAGLLPWTFFATVVTSASASVVGSERLITKVYFPRLAIPLAALGVAALDFAFACLPLIALMVYYGVPPSPAVFALPVVVVLVALAALGVGTFFAALNVAYRDVRYVIPFVIQVWLFATPTVYVEWGTDALPALGSLLGINPMMGLTAAFRAATLGSAMSWHLLAISASSALVGLIGGCLYFRKIEDSFADVI